MEFGPLRIAGERTYSASAYAILVESALQTVLIAMVGGPSKLRGPILGAFIFSLLAEALRLQLPYLYMIVLGVLLILSVLFLPQGLAGVRWIDRLLAPRSRPGAEASHV